MDFPYDLNQPEKKLKLPNVLEEISGLTYAGDDKVYCVQDEKGDLFLYDLTKDEILWKVSFGKSGDYEGVAKAKDEIFVLRSDGKLYGFSEPSKDQEIGEVVKVQLDLGEDCNAEGLEYDPIQHRLLIACKGESKKEKRKKRFYEIDLHSDEWKAESLFSFSAADIQDPNNWISQERYDNASMSPRKVDEFNPSGIASHPITGELYVVSSVGNVLVVVSAEYQIKQIIHLKGDQFRQPEGITFNENGHLMISNEGDGKRGNIYLFPYNLH